MPVNNPLLARFDGKPFMVAEEMQAVFESCLEQGSAQLDRIHADTSQPKMMEEDDFWYAEDDWRSMFQPYRVKDGILQIPVKGVLLHDFPFAIGSFVTGYDYIWKAFQRGMDDSNVQGIALVIDSPGGEVAGNFDLVDRMYERSGEKPVRAYAAESAYSAAYSIASAADSITVTRTGGVGSVGVITAHIDVSEAMENVGVKITFIHFGKRKKDGNPYEKLSDEVKQKIQTRIDELGEVFVSTVARNRSMDAQDVRNTEAATFTASESVSNGMADQIGALDDAIAAFAADLSLEEDDETMTKENGAAQEAAEKENQKAVANAHSDGMAEGAKNERERISTIMQSDEGKKRPTVATKMALSDKFAALDAETITEMLAEMPEEKAEETPPETTDEPRGKEGAQGDFLTHMNNSENPGVGQPGAQSEDDKRAQRRQRAAAAAGRAKPAN